MEPGSPEAPDPDSPALARHRGLAARAALISFLTLVSRLLGFAREALMAAVFGERSAISDAFLTAWRVPNLFRRLLGEGALATSLQTAMTKADLQRGDAAGRALFRATLRATFLALVAVTLLGALLAWVLPDRMPVTGWAWLGSDPAPVRDLTARVLPYVVLVCLAALCGGALAVRGHFAMPNLAPAAMNLVWIGTLVAIGLHSSWGRPLATPEETLQRQWELARWLAWGLLLGGLLQLLLHLPPLWRHGLVGARGGGEPGEDAARREGLREVLWTMLPLVLGGAIYQINVMVDGLMAEGLLRTGGPSALYYANRVQQFPMALVSTAAVNAVFPALNAHGHLGERLRVRGLYDRTQLGMLFLLLPAAAGLFALALPIASVCYEHGNYGADGTARVAEGLRCLAFALVPAGAAALASRVFVAMGDLRTPVRIAGWMVLVNVSLNVLCVVGLGLDVAGMTLATALTTWLNLAWLVRGLRTRLALPPGVPLLGARVARLALAALLCAGTAWGTQRLWTSGMEAAAARGSIPALMAALAAGGLVYALTTRALGVEEWDEVARRLRRKLGSGAGTGD